MYIVNSAAEENAIYQTLPFIGVDNVHYWIGLYQDVNDQSYSEPSGAWKWVDGTYLTGYSNWAAGEPNNASPGELYAQFEWSDYGLQWNDAGFPAQNGTQFSLTIYELGGGNPTNANFSWSTNATDPTISVSPTANTTYSCTVTSGSQTCTATVDIAVNPAVTNTISASIVEGETYTLGTQTLTTAGTYTEVFTSAAGCDSTVTLNLSVEPALSCSIEASQIEICVGQSVVLNNINSQVTVQDSILIDAFTMTVNSYYSHFTPILENGKTYKIRVNGRYGFADGWQHNDAAWNYAWDMATQTKVWCNGTQDAWPDVRWLLNGQTDFARPDNDISNNGNFCSGIDKIYFWTVNGANSPYHFEWIDGAYGDNSGSLTFEIYELLNNDSFNSSIVWSTNETIPTITVSPTANTTYSCTVTSGSQTCTATVDITVNPAVTNTISASIVEGGSYILGTQTLTTAGTYTEVFTSSTGCDSTVTLTLDVEPLLSCNITAPVSTICEGESVTLSVNTTAGSGSSSQLPINLQQGLVAYYPFNGNANDESGNGIDGIANGATLIADRFGNSNSAYSFDGVDDYISFPNSNTIGITSFSGITISLWFQVNLVENIRIFHFFNQSLDLTIHNSALGAVHCANYNSAGGGFNFLQIATPPSNQLVHFTWSLDFISNTASVYLDGMLHNQIPIPGAILSSDMMYEIGTANGWILNGSVDDVAIFSCTPRNPSLGTRVQQLTPSRLRQPPIPITVAP
jgi:hypothetical protein